VQDAAHAPLQGLVDHLVLLHARLAGKLLGDDMGIREGIKSFSQWPTIPQLYVKGEFVGGCDIIREMFQEGELTQLLDE